MNDRLYNLLLKSLDSELRPEAQKELENALKESEEMRLAQDELLKLRTSLNRKSEHNFSAGFEERVMARISDLQQETINSGLNLIFRPVAIAAVALIIILASFNMASSDQFTVQGAFAVTEVAPEEAFNPLVDLLKE